MNFVRIHKKPRRCRIGFMEKPTSQQEYLSKRSYERYLNTEDGKYLSEYMSKRIDGIGRVDSVRFIRSTEVLL